MNNLITPIKDHISPNEVIRREKDFYIKKLVLTAFNGKKYDLIGHRINLFYYEDIFSSALTGTLTVLDAVDYPQFMPIIGEERLEVVLTRQDEHGKGEEGSFLKDLEMNFRIYKMSGRQISNEKVQSYALHLISEEFIKNLKTKIYHSWNDVPYSKMVEEIYNKKIKIKKPIFVEKTKYDQDFSASNLSPFELFNMLVPRSISDDGNGETYVFYEDREAFHYKSLGKLLKEPSKEKYVHSPRQLLVGSNNKFAYKEVPIEYEVKNIEHYFWNAQHDILKNIEAGMYGQHLVTVDVVRQKFDFLKFNLKKEYKTFSHLEKSQFFTNDLDALPINDDDVFHHTKVMSTNKDHDIIDHIASKEPGIKPYKLEEYALRRTSFLNQIHQFRVGVSVSGDPRRKVGDIIEFDLPQVAGDVSRERPEELDRYFQGKYLIVSIRHTLSLTDYSMEFEIVKDSFANKIQHTDIVEKYKDIY